MHGYQAGDCLASNFQLKAFPPEFSNQIYMQLSFSNLMNEQHLVKVIKIRFLNNYDFYFRRNGFLWGNYAGGSLEPL